MQSSGKHEPRARRPGPELRRSCAMARMVLLAAAFATTAQLATAQTIDSVTMVSQLTGENTEMQFHCRFGGLSPCPDPDNPGASQAAQVHGTDLGTSYVGADGTVRFFFGDTLAPYPLVNLRSNIMATTTDMNASNGVTLTYATDASGIAREIFPDSGDIGLYATTGWSDPNTGREWAAVMHIQRSTWTPLANAIWTTTDGWQSDYTTTYYNFSAYPVTASFEQVYAIEWQGYYYFYGSKLNQVPFQIARGENPQHTSGVQIMRIPTADMVDMTMFNARPELYVRCGSQNAWVEIPDVTPNGCTPINIIPAPASDGSVMYHPGLGKFVGLSLDPIYRDPGTNLVIGKVRIGYANRPEGPWGNASDVVVGDNCGPYDNSYAPLIMPAHASGKTLYFSLSRWIGDYGPVCRWWIPFFCNEAQYWWPTCNHVYNTFVMRVDFR